MIRAAFILFGLVAIAATAPAAVLDVGRLADQLRAVENWRGQDGAAGERGPYQISRAVWQNRMPGVAFSQARLEGPARECATRHIAWLRSGLRAAGWADTPYNIALAWNAGLERTLSGSARAPSRDFAQRVQNLYLEPVGAAKTRRP
jgi:hypothetical protein